MITRILRVVAVGIVLLTFSSNSFSQDGDVDKYFDDGGISGSKNVVKLGVTNILIGEIPVFLERKLSHTISVEGSIGTILPHYQGTLLGAIIGSDKYSNISGGFRWSLSPRLYFSKDAPEGNYIAFRYRKRNINHTDGAYTNNIDYGIMWGYQMFLTNRLTLETKMEVAYFEEDSNYVNSYLIDKFFSVDFNVSIGYMF